MNSLANKDTNGERFRPYVAALTLLIKDEQVLLMRRFNTGWHDGDYSLPGGHIEDGETASKGAARETLEEIGVVVDPKKLAFAHTMYRKNYTGSIYVDFFFIAKEWKGKPTNIEPHKCDDIAWFNMRELPENITPFVRNMIHDYLHGKFYSEPGWLTD